MYTILKPEIARRSYRVEPYLERYGFNLKTAHAIKNWESLAKKLYAPQINAEPQFAIDINAYLWLTKHFFGNRAILLLLTGGEKDFERLQKLSAIKSEIRNEFYAEDEPVKIILNTSKVCNLNNGLGETHRSERVPNSPLIIEGSDSKWDYFFFKYLHVPDLDIEVYRREMKVIQEEGILENIVSPYQWLQMKQMKTFIPLGESL